MSGRSLSKGLASACAVLLAAACTADAPTRAEPDGSHMQGPVLSVASAEISQQLAELRRLTAPFHNIQKAREAGYTVVFPCVSDPALGGMGVHIAHEDLSRLSDNQVNLLEPEFLVYAPDANGRLVLSAFDYFIPYSEVWPGPDAGGVPPTLLGLEFRPSERFQAWIFHIWLWRHNPAGMFAPNNPNVSCAAAGGEHSEGGQH